MYIHLESIKYDNLESVEYTNLESVEYIDLESLIYTWGMLRFQRPIINRVEYY